MLWKIILFACNTAFFRPEIKLRRPSYGLALHRMERFILTLYRRLM
ncbi:hypothetical protein [Hoylesella nanceiensis]|uniref:Uncharacterized protein n=1 Tax=Hoylesella nanceiensis TaxID=425941 RepID=A0ABS6YE55_9BACT|nr:hypothetical protein [Hoylesella nanceiensis]MBW4769008.1 hypothetical protein [Hoylesella nanceiensis]